MNRSQWEEPGWRIGDHTGSPPVDLAALQWIVLHYPAGPLPTVSHVAWLRQLQRYSVNSRGYSLYYNWSIWTTGERGEIRGYDYRNAANDAPGRPGNENLQSVSLLLVVGGSGTTAAGATPPQIVAVREAVAEIRARCGRHLPIIGHGDLEPTGCPGGGISAQLADGLFEPTQTPTPTPPTPAPGDDDMTTVLVLEDARNGAWYRCGADTKSWIRDGNMAAQIIARLEETNASGVAIDGMRYTKLTNGNIDFIRSTGPIVGPVPAGVDEYGG